MDNKKVKVLLDNMDIEHPSVVCPIKDILATMFDKWTMMIVLVLGKHKVLRFADIKRSVVGISPKMLTQSLRKLERDGHVKRTVYPEVPIRVEYNLTKQGDQFLNKLADLAEWILPYVPTIIKNRKEFAK